MTISKEFLDELLSGVDRPEDLLGDKGLMKELKVRLMERMLGAELAEHLGYEPYGEPASQQANRRNGVTRKVLKSNDGAVPIDIPRDREGSFEPELIQKGQTRIDGMDDKIIGLYAAGLSTRDRALAYPDVAITCAANAQLTFGNPTNPYWAPFFFCLFAGPITRKSQPWATPPPSSPKSPTGHGSPGHINRCWTPTTRGQRATA